MAVDKAPPCAGVPTFTDKGSALAGLPSVDRLLALPALDAQAAACGPASVKLAVQEALNEARTAMRSGAPLPTEATLAERALALVGQRVASRMREVVNLTGTVIHTNLGRALLGEEAIDAVARAMRGYTALEFDLGQAGRGERDDIVEGLLRELTGAEAATVVNNNAGAVLLSLAALAGRKEAVVSHGELIEIGGAFRLPDIMKAAGCRLVAVGTTNRTHPRDYEGAIGARTGVVVRAHWSNYAITGFTSVVDDRTLAGIAHAAGVPLLVDLGAGALVDLTRFGLPHEPLPGEALAAGADVVTFSGDKLLGGPQAGLIVGSRDAVARIRKHPLKRALRCSKITLAALEATLRVYASDYRLEERLPVLALLTRKRADIRAACERLRPALASWAGEQFDVGIEDCASQIGSGSLPVDRLDSSALVVGLRDPRAKGRHLVALAERLRALPQPVLGRLHEGKLWLDLRCLRPADEPRLLGQLGAGRT